MIDNLTVINLPHRTDRKNFMIGHLETAGVPLHIINFFPAKYGKEYKDLEEIREGMVADGFDFIRHADLPYQDNLASCCYYWNWLLILREFMNSARASMIMIDDRMLKIGWDTLIETVNLLYRSHSPFKILQVGWSALWKGERQKIEPISGLVARGIRSNGDYATVFSNEGAKWMYDQLVKTYASPEPFFFKLSQPGIDNTGMFHMIESQTKDAGLAWKEDLWV